MKPHIKKIRGQTNWMCFRLGYPFRALGKGNSPMEAYHDFNGKNYYGWRN